jgi:adenylate cyclase
LKDPDKTDVLAYNGNMLQATERLIITKEKQGIATSLITKQVTLVTMILLQGIFSHTLSEVIHMLIIGGTILIITTLCLIILLKNRARTLMGIISVTADLLLIVALPLIWFEGDMGVSGGRIKLLETGIPFIMLLIMVINTISFNPLYPLIFTAGSTLWMTLLYVIATRDPLTADMLAGRVEGFQPGSMMELYHVWTAMLAVTGLLLSYVAWSFRRNLKTSVRNEVKSSQLSRFFSPNVAESIANQKEDFFKPGGRIQPVAVMFTDIRGFTTLTEKHTPAEVLTMLSEYHAFMVRIILDCGGTLDKFIGDGILATFGTPEPTDRDADNALTAALQMREALAGYNADRERRGLFTIAHGIGIHYGDAIVGNVGVENRLEYTVIGDTVNVASRLEGATKTTGFDLAVSADLVSRLSGAYPLKPAGNIQVRGRNAPVMLFTA